MRYNKTMEYPTEVTTKQLDNFFDKVDIPNFTSCWVWNAYKLRDGYGRVGISGRNYLSHRLLYSLALDGVDEDLVMDHLCRNRACVNPLHLRQTTIEVNVKTGKSGEYNKNKKTCPKGHSYNKENTRYKKSGGYTRRVCRKCDLTYVSK
jgi:hypothetical protein